MFQLPFWNYWHYLDMQKEVTLFKMLHCISSQCQRHCPALNQSMYFGKRVCAMFCFLGERAVGWVHKLLYIKQVPGINTTFINFMWAFPGLRGYLKLTHTTTLNINWQVEELWYTTRTISNLHIPSNLKHFKNKHILHHRGSSNAN